jgi:DHA2 family multidrug resistance protein
MPFMFVTLGAVALSTVGKENLTAASSIYTLAQRVSGNIGYALVATLVARGTQAQRVHLVSWLEATPQYEQFSSQVMAVLHAQGAIAKRGSEHDVGSGRPHGEPADADAGV